MSPVMARMVELTTPVGTGDLLGKSVTVKLELVKGGFRSFPGYVTPFAQGDTIGRYQEYA